MAIKKSRDEGHYIRLPMMTEEEFSSRQSSVDGSTMFDVRLPVFTGVTRVQDDSPVYAVWHLAVPMDGMTSDALEEKDGNPLHVASMIDMNSPNLEHPRRAVWAELNPTLLAEKQGYDVSRQFGLDPLRKSPVQRPFHITQRMGNVATLNDIKAAVAATAAEKYMFSAVPGYSSRGLYTKEQIDAASGAIFGAFRDYVRERSEDKTGRTGFKQLGLSVWERSDGFELDRAFHGNFDRACENGAFDEFRNGLSEKLTERVNALPDRRAAALAKSISLSLEPDKNGCRVYADASHDCTISALYHLSSGCPYAYDVRSNTYDREILSNAAKMMSYGMSQHSAGYENLIHTMTQNGDWHVADRSDFPDLLDRGAIREITDVPDGNDINKVNDAAAKLVGSFARINPDLLKGTGLSVNEDGYLSMSDEAMARTPDGYAAVKRFGMAANEFMKSHPLRIHDVVLEAGKKPVSGDYAAFLGDLKFDRNSSSLETKSIYVCYGGDGFGMKGPEAEAVKSRSDDDDKRWSGVSSPAAPSGLSAYERLMRMCADADEHDTPESPEVEY